MSKKFGKFLLFSAVAGAAAYGTYYYLQKKEQVPASPAEDDTDDDFDDFSEDLDEEVPPVKERTYVSLNLDKAEAIAQEAFHRAKEVIVDSVQQVKDTVKSVKESQAVNESNFTDLTALNKEHAASSETANEQPDAELSNEEAADEQPVEMSVKTPEDTGDTDSIPESSAVNSEVQSTVSAEDAIAEDTIKESNIKGTANGQVEDFFDDTP